ncbi:MAG: hypothetical protein HY318_03000, partial [Armatimonadetes bacterium]|nr:hypothetical protein [Armatimonadota bacterium]
MHTPGTSPLSGLSRPFVSFLAPNVARWTLALLSLWVRTEGVAQTPVPQSVWIESEHLLGVKGANFSYFKEDRQAKGTWGISGPGVAAEWTQGGESEWMSIAARADEPSAVASFPFEVPVSGRYRLWVRYADYREAREEFGVRISQNKQVKTDHRFGAEPVIDENDQMKLFWKWAFGWDFVEVELSEGPALLELYTPGPTEARRQVDCFCLTTDKEYRPHHKEKPMMAAWRPLEAYLKEGRPPRAPLAARTNNFAVSPSWKLRSFPGHPLLMLWNVGEGWLKELANGSSPWQKYPFHIDSGWTEDFKRKFAGREDLPIFSSPMIAPVIHIPFLPAQFSSDSPFLKWLTQTKRPFGVLLNYGEPNFAGTQESKESIFRSFSAMKDQFVGYIAGESLGYLTYDAKDLNDRISTAKSRAEIYQILSRAFTEATNAKYTSYSGSPVSDGWRNVISCTSAGMLGYAHALGNWGCRWIGHEDHTSGAGLAMRLAFQRGAARQFGAGMLGYMSCNFGDAA